ncbi:MAG: CBS domain-containing protein [Acidimicrobiia bacterium]|nr:CBS domain-containing protein [Acidimicrobiia bacterium]
MPKYPRDVVTPDPACCTPDMTLDQVAKLMVQNDCGEIPVSRRVPVVDEQGCCTGIIAQADIAWNEQPRGVAELVREVSRDTTLPSR